MSNTKAFAKKNYQVGTGTSAAFAGKTLQVSLPAQRWFDAEVETLDFSSVEERLDVSGKLYLYAGQFLTCLPADNQMSKDIIRQYFSWMSGPRFSNISLSYESWDHATAMRIEALQYLKVTQPEVWTEDATAILYRDLTWALEKENIKLNNHGIFLLNSLLFVAKTGTPDQQKFSQNNLVDYAAKHLMSIVEYVYRDDGWCAENSPQYDRVWLALLRRVNNSFGDLLAETEIENKFDDILDKATKLISAQVYQDGHLVPRGDTQRLKTTEATLMGTHYSTRVGIWTHANTDLFLMATAGHTSITHKHVDDTQLLLSYRSVDFFIDGGHHGHIYSDPRVPALKSPVGHSVLTVPQFDELPPWLAYLGDEPKIRASMLHADSRSVIMRKSLGNAGTLHRDILLSQDCVHVTDSWILHGDYSPTSRFLLPSSCFIDWDQRALVITREGKRVRITFDKDIEISITTAEDAAPYRGWASRRSGAFEPAHCVDIQPSERSPSGALTYRISTEELPEDTRQQFEAAQNGQHGGIIASKSGQAKLWSVSGFAKQYPIIGNTQTEITYSTVGDRASDKAGVLEIAFYDQGHHRLNLVDWGNVSPKFGDYRYLLVGQNGRTSERFTVPTPKGAHYLVLKGHSWLDYGPMFFSTPPVVRAS